jgi:hypothetical protein
MCVQGVLNLADRVARHGGVDLGRQLDEAGRVINGFQLPRKVERVDRDAVPAQAGPGTNFM